MNQNILKLIDDKTELIVFTSKYMQDLYNDLSITIGGTVVDCSSQVRDLGVIFDRVLSLRYICIKYYMAWHQGRDGTILMVCCMDSQNVLFLACKRFKTQLHVL